MNDDQEYPNDPPASQEDIDIIYQVVDNMMKNGEWNELSKFFYGFLTQVNEMPLDIMLAYITATLPAGSKIMYRRQFIDLCKKRFPGEQLWQGL